MQSPNDTIARHERILERVEESLLKKLEEKGWVEKLDIKEFNTIVLLLKRIQEARRSLILDAKKLEKSNTEGETRNGNGEPDPMDDAEISRILALIDESNGEEKGTDPQEV